MEGEDMGELGEEIFEGCGYLRVLPSFDSLSLPHFLPLFFC